MAPRPEIQLASPAVDFIDNRLATHHPAFESTPTHYDGTVSCYVVDQSLTEVSRPQQASPEPQPIVLATTEASQDESEPPDEQIEFSAVMDAFKDKFPNEPKGRAEKHFSIRDKSTWEEVLELLDSAAEAHASESGAKGKFKKAARLIGERSDTVKRLTSLVPDVDYSKPILGTITFLLEAFKRTNKVRIAVKDGLEDLKDRFGDIQSYLALYSKKPKVVDAVLSLYVTMLKATEEAIGYFTRHIVIKGLDAVWSGERYEQSLLECLEQLAGDGKKLIHQAQNANMQVNNEVLQRANSIKDTQNSLLSMFEEHIRQKDVKLQQQEEAIGRHKAEKARLQRQLDAAARDKALWQERYYQSSSNTTYYQPAISQSDLLRFLSYSGQDDTDLEYILHHETRLTARGQDRSDQIMASKFKDWLVSPSSRELLIHGSGESQPVSSISFFCAMVVQNLRKVSRFRSVAFFCGRHLDHDNGGGRVMIMSLLAQLLQQQTFDTSFIDPELVYRMDTGDIEAFCYIFVCLVQQINVTDTVFCVIDGINFYERNEEMLQEMAFVLRTLLDLTRESSVFKILITSPSTTEDVRQAVEEEDFLVLPEQTRESRNFSELRFERQLSPALF